MNKKSNIWRSVSGFGVWIACLAAPQTPKPPPPFCLRYFCNRKKKQQYLPNKLAPEIITY